MLETFSLVNQKLANISGFLMLIGLKNAVLNRAA